MIDTLNLQLDSTQFDYKHIKQIFQDKLDFIADNRFKNGSSTTVHHGNYKFSLSEKYLTATGSLTKLFYGNNIQNLNFTQIHQALMQFETLFEIPFDNAKIKRLDVAANMQMDMPINLYLDLLTTPEHYKLRLYEGETKSFEGSKNKLLFYDKVAEVRKNDRASYSAFQNTYILKYEISLTKNIAKNLSLQDFTMKNLFDPVVYEYLLNEWQAGYYRIPKLTKMLPSQISYQTLSSFKDSLILQGMNSMGGVEVLNMAINQADIKKNVKYLIKNYVEGIKNVEPLSPVLQYELDAKINDIYNNELVLIH
jgi:hypothetical protein